MKAGTTLSLDEIVQQTRDLPDDVVTELVDRILAAKHGASEELSPAWRTEIHRRLAEVERGEVKGTSFEEVQAKARQSLGL